MQHTHHNGSHAHRNYTSQWTQHTLQPQSRFEIYLCLPSYNPLCILPSLRFIMFPHWLNFVGWDPTAVHWHLCDRPLRIVANWPDSRGTSQLCNCVCLTGTWPRSALPPHQLAALSCGNLQKSYSHGFDQMYSGISTLFYFELVSSRSSRTHIWLYLPLAWWLGGCLSRITHLSA